MATVTHVVLTCDVCGNAKDVQTWTFGLDGKAYEVDLCPKDGKALNRVTARYTSNARNVSAGHGQRHNGQKPRSGAAAAPQAAKASGPEANATGSGRRKNGRPRPRKAQAAPRQRAEPTGARRDKGIYVYGILPADIEMADETPGVGEPPAPLRAVRCDGLAALISEVSQSARLGSPDDRRAHREILDATATEVPVLPLRFGTVLPSEDAVAQELLGAHRDEFAAALEQLEGRAEFLVKGCYVQEEFAAKRTEDIQALQRAMEGVCVASAVGQPAHGLDVGHVAFLVAVDQESEVERVIADLAREWEGRVDIQLLGPMAAYDFVGYAQD
jgi:hypothetical protein